MTGTMGWKLDSAGLGLFIVATAEAFNVFSAFCSSPWTAETFGQDPDKAKSTKQYVLMASGANVGLGLGAGLLANSWWPLVGTASVSVLMIAIYWRALGKATGSSAQWRGQQWAA